MQHPAGDWRAAASTIGRLAGTYIGASGETAKLEDIAVAVGLDPALIDRTLQGAIDPPLSVAARLARHSGAALVALPGDVETPQPFRGPSDLQASDGDVAELQAILRRLRRTTGLPLPAFALVHGLPLASTAAAETDPLAATMGGAAAFAGRFGFVLKVVPAGYVAQALAASEKAGRPKAHGDLSDPGNAPSDVEWIRRALEEAMTLSRLDAPTLARRVHLPEAVSNDPETCKIIGPFRTTASLAAGLGLTLSVVERNDRNEALIRLGTHLSEARPAPGLSSAGARRAVRVQEKAVLTAVKRRRCETGRDHAEVAAACGTTERAIRDAERGLMPLPVQRVARHAEALGLALVLQPG